MTLHGAPLLYVFFYTAALSRQRELCERILGLPVIENQFHPPHEYHGLVKYDGGNIILSLNLARESRFQKDASDGLITVLSVDKTAYVQERLRQHGYTPPQETNGVFTDAYGHHYIFRNASPSAAEATRHALPAVQELRLTVGDLSTSIAFYAGLLGLDPLKRTANQARFATGTVDLVLQAARAAPDGRALRYSTYLIVFYAENILETREALVRRGLHFTGTRVGFSDIGGTARFVDPSGHIFCLYEPSQESLTWGSGSKVKELIAGCRTADVRI